MKRYHFFFCVLISLVGIFSNAQTHLLKKAEKNFELARYSRAIKFYDKYFTKTADSSVLVPLATSYYQIGNYAKAFASYQEYLKYNTVDNLSSEQLFHLINLSHSTRNEALALKYQQQFNSKFPNDNRAHLFLNQSLIKQYINTFKSKYSIESLNLNSPYSEYSYFASNGGSFFVSNKPTTQNTANSGHFSKLFYFDNKEGKAVPLKLNTKNEFHESSAVATSDGKYLYVTQSAPGKDKNIYLKIIRYTANNEGAWVNPEDLSINGPNFNTAHPTLNAEENTLIFSSNRPGGFGKSDLYKSEIRSDGSLSEPLNLGHRINTPSRENFPFYAQEGTLFFSSDGHPGKGGLDIYGIFLNDPNALAINLGEELNSTMDDFSFTIKDGVGHMSSNRAGGEGADDIYKVIIANPIDFKCNSKITGLVLDQNQKPLENAIIKIYKEDQLIATTKSSATGFYFFKGLDCGAQFFVEVLHNEYKKERIIAQTSNLYSSNKLSSIFMEMNEPTVAESNTIKNSKIYFGFDKATYLPQGEAVVENLFNYLKNNPNQQLLINSYTDPTGPVEYNQQLSVRRSNYIKDQLLKRGIRPEQIVAQGGGEFSSELPPGTQNKLKRVSEFSVQSLPAQDLVAEKTSPSEPVERIQFSFDSSQYFLSENYMKIINKMVDLLRADTSLNLEISGHTDSFGAAAYNLKLSQKRAEFIRNILVEKGITANRLTAIGRGETQPLIACSPEDNCTIETHRMNRRVEFRTIKN